MQNRKLFPLKLPSNYHGPVKTFQTSTDKYLKRLSNKQQADEPTKKISKWQRKISDVDVLNQRKEYLVHPAKISKDNPDWLKSTYHYYHRSQSKPNHRESQADKKNFDVFGQKKLDLPATKLSQSAPYIRKQPINKEVTSKIGVQFQGTFGLRKSKGPQQIANKIGFVEARVNLVKKPQLKIGSLHQNNYVNTYTVN